jgi:hypothetical protein
MDGKDKDSFPEISRGAALAHGCCSGYRQPSDSLVNAKPTLVLHQGVSKERSEANSNKAKGEAKAKHTVRDGVLANVRQAQGMLQQDIATRLDVSQAHIANIEQKSDMLLSTLRRYVRSLGGELDLVARFPEVSFHLGSIETPDSNR